MNPINALPLFSTKIIRRTAWADSAGVTASILCAIHCAAMPLLASYLPQLGLSWLANESFHRWMAGACFLLAGLAFGPGWKSHRRVGPALIGLVGVGFLVAGSFTGGGDCCSGCAAPSFNSDEEVFVEVPADFFAQCSTPNAASLAWLVTPIGGALLVAGHLANHHCRCACCRRHERAIQ